MLLAATASAQPSSTLEIQVANLRSTKGFVRVCVTALPAHFPDCRGDPNAHTASVPASDAKTIRIAGIAQGDYAIALLHDENGNARMDTFMAMPREGYGFSRDAAVSFGPPSFKAAQFAVGSGVNHESIRMRYVL